MISAVVILYYPNSTLNKNLAPIISLVDQVYIVDNTEISKIDVIDQTIINSNKVRYIHNGKNEGIAKPLNKICQLAIRDKFQFLLTMDQDSLFEVDILKRYISQIQSFNEQHKVGMFGVNPVTVKEIILQNSGSDFELVTQLITSGSIINLNNFYAIGSFDEQLFIDQVDSEYCFKILQAGLKIIKFNNIYMEHKLGTLKEHVSVKNLKKSTRSLHPSIRIYYMVRNFFYISSRYKLSFPKEINDLKKDILNRIKNNFLYGGNKLQLILFIMRGYYDFKRKRMGKISV